MERLAMEICISSPIKALAFIFAMRYNNLPKQLKLAMKH